MEMGFNDLRPADTGDSGQELRPLGWRELCARLAAAQDLRRILVEHPDQSQPAGGASFHQSAARLLVSRAMNGIRPERKIAGETVVNPTSLANGKAPAGTSAVMHAEPPLPVERS